MAAEPGTLDGARVGPGVHERHKAVADAADPTLDVNGPHTEPSKHACRGGEIGFHLGEPFRPCGEDVQSWVLEIFTHGPKGPSDGTVVKVVPRLSAFLTDYKFCHLLNCSFFVVLYTLLLLSVLLFSSSIDYKLKKKKIAFFDIRDDFFS